MTSDLHVALREIIGWPCVRAQNPHGSIISLDFGTLELAKDAVPKELPTGRRSITVYSPWRVEDDAAIHFDWNVDGGATGRLRELIRVFEGLQVVSTAAKAPAWDLRVVFSNGLCLVVFGDFHDERDFSWDLNGTDGLMLSARPIARPL
ncbi:MAG: hypothetical protein ACJ796_05040 [Gemmatimonadaceae bacterium]